MEQLGATQGSAAGSTGGKGTAQRGDVQSSHGGVCVCVCACLLLSPTSPACASSRAVCLAPQAAASMMLPLNHVSAASAIQLLKCHWMYSTCLLLSLCVCVCVSHWHCSASALLRLLGVRPTFSSCTARCLAAWSTAQGCYQTRRRCCSMLRRHSRHAGRSSTSSGTARFLNLSR